MSIPSDVDGEGAMNKGNMRRWCRLFREGTTVRDRTQPLVLVHSSNKFNWEIFEHPPYIPHLASGDYRLLLHIKIFLAGQSLRSDQETKDAPDWLKVLAATFLDEGIMI
jgi:hypothetical protein